MHRAVPEIQEEREAGQVQVVRAVRGEREAERKVRAVPREREEAAAQAVPRAEREAWTQAVPRRCGQQETEQGVRVVPREREEAAARAVPAVREASAAAPI